MTNPPQIPPPPLDDRTDFVPVDDNFVFYMGPPPPPEDPFESIEGELRQKIRILEATVQRYDTDAQIIEDGSTGELEEQRAGYEGRINDLTAQLAQITQQKDVLRDRYLSLLRSANRGDYTPILAEMAEQLRVGINAEVRRQTQQTIDDLTEKLEALSGVLGTDNPDVAIVHVNDIKTENRKIWGYGGIVTAVAAGLLIALLYKQCGPSTGNTSSIARTDNCSSYKANVAQLENDLATAKKAGTGVQVQYKQPPCPTPQPYVVTIVDCSAQDARIRSLEGQLASAGECPPATPCAVCASSAPCPEHTPCPTPAPTASPQIRYQDRRVEVRVPGDCSEQDALLARMSKHAQYCIDLERAVSTNDLSLFQSTVQGYIALTSPIDLVIPDDNVGNTTYALTAAVRKVCPTLDNEAYTVASRMYRNVFPKDTRTASSDLNAKRFMGK